ncbi:MAG: fatty acid desaturase [Acidobacteriota bacterium]|nr:fatty acid desaturase [Acidobacteriota bacterium]
MKLHDDELALARAWSAAEPFEGLSDAQMNGIMERGRVLFKWTRAHTGLHNALNACVLVFLFVADYLAILRLPGLFLRPGETNRIGAILLAALISGSIHSFLMYSLSVFSMHEGAAHRMIFLGKSRFARATQAVAGNLCRLAASDPECYAPHHMQHHAHFGSVEDAEFLNFIGLKRYLMTFLPLAAFVNFSDFVAHRPLTYTRSRAISALLSVSYSLVYAWFAMQAWGGLFTIVSFVAVLPHAGFYLDRLRQFTEHNLMPLENRDGSRSFGLGFWGMLIGGGPWGSPCHWEHHLVASLPWYQQLVLHRYIVGILSDRQKEQFLLRPAIGFPLLWWKVLRQVRAFEKHKSVRVAAATGGPV